LEDASQSSLRAIRLAHREDGVARHLRAQGRLLPQGSVTELMQGDPIPTARCLHQRYEPIARIGVGGPQCTQSGGLLRRHTQSNASSAHHALAPVGDLLGTLDIAPDGRAAERTCGADVVRRGPKMPARRSLHGCEKALEQVPGAHALEHPVGRLVDAVPMSDPINHASMVTCISIQVKPLTQFLTLKSGVTDSDFESFAEMGLLSANLMGASRVRYAKGRKAAVVAQLPSAWKFISQKREASMQDSVKAAKRVAPPRRRPAPVAGSVKSGSRRAGIRHNVTELPYASAPDWLNDRRRTSG
jgi:hypothetical protein